MYNIFLWSIEDTRTVISALSVFISFLALFFTKCEYDKHVERRKSDTLSKLSERYATDRNIETVIGELLASYEDNDGAYLKSKLETKKIYTVENCLFVSLTNCHTQLKRIR